MPEPDQQPTMVRYADFCRTLGRKLMRNDPLEEGERIFLSSLLDGAAGTFGAAWFAVSQYVEPSAVVLAEGRPT